MHSFSSFFVQQSVPAAIVTLGPTFRWKLEQVRLHNHCIVYKLIGTPVFCPSPQSCMCIVLPQKCCRLMFLGKTWLNFRTIEFENQYSDL